MKKLTLPEARYWWQVLPALPVSKHHQTYHALRRVWADHTMNTSAKGRGYYRWGSEDNLTPCLFQTWSIFTDPGAFEALLGAVGVKTAGLVSVRWAYACEEEIVRGSHAGVTGRFLIPDIVMHFEDQAGPGLVAFEVKRPGAKPTEKDGAKLAAYYQLASMKSIPRRQGCFLVGAGEAGAARGLPGNFAVLTWEGLRDLMLKALASCNQPSPREAQVGAWIKRAFARYGIGSAPAPQSLSDSGDYGNRRAYSQIDDMALPPEIAGFLKGSEATEAFYRGRLAECPANWLVGTLCREELSARRLQLTAHRKLCRWSPAWRQESEPALP